MIEQIPIVCDNKLFIHARTPKEIEDFLEGIMGHYSGEDPRKPKHPTLNSFVPINELDERKRIKKSLARWGTVADMIPLVERVSKNGQEALLEFLTPMTPPAVWLIDVGKMFPNMLFRLEYEIPGTEIYGYEMRLGDWAISVVGGVDEDES